MTRRARRIMFVVAWAALLFMAPQAVGTPSWLGDVPGLGNTADDVPRPDASFRLSGCTISNPLYNRDAESVDDVVPDDYQLATNAFFPTGATVIAALLSCHDVSPSRRSAVLMVVAVQVVPRPRPGDLADQLWQVYDRSPLNFLPSSSWYLVAAETDNAELARRLRQGGTPVTVDRHLHDTPDYRGVIKSDSVSGKTFSLAAHTALPDPFVHNHDWFFWSGSGANKRAFFLHLHAMKDSSCGYHLSRAVEKLPADCGATLTADAGTPIAELLGTSAHTPYAFNHPLTSTWGYIDIPSPRGGDR